MIAHLTPADMARMNLSGLSLGQTIAPAALGGELTDAALLAQMLREKRTAVKYIASYFIVGLPAVQVQPTTQGYIQVLPNNPARKALLVQVYGNTVSGTGTSKIGLWFQDTSSTFVDLSTNTVLLNQTILTSYQLTRPNEDNLDILMPNKSMSHIGMRQFSKGVQNAVTLVANYHGSAGKPAIVVMMEGY